MQTKAITANRVENLPKHTVVFFDGVCNFCNGIVNALIDRDRRNALHYAPLQGPTYASVRQVFDHAPDDLTSIVLLRNGRIYVRSEAALQICLALGGMWKLLSIGYLLPAFIRDRLYTFVAQRRYRWFGMSETCRIPTPELRARFLD